jgi:hypothetical protein
VPPHGVCLPVASSGTSEGSAHDRGTVARCADHCRDRTPSARGSGRPQLQPSRKAARSGVLGLPGRSDQRRGWPVPGRCTFVWVCVDRDLGDLPRDDTHGAGTDGHPYGSGPRDSGTAELLVATAAALTGALGSAATTRPSGPFGPGRSAERR